MSLTEKEIPKDYIRRIDKALHYIEEHLHQELSLASVAEVAHYSPFHFHRIFKAITNETLNSYINRKRIEKTASVLMRGKGIVITELAMEYGFNSNSSFTRAFKKFYGMSPTEFRKLSPGKYSKICKTESKNGQKSSLFEEYICNIDNHKNWIKMNAKVEVKQMPGFNLAYITHIGDKGLDKAFEKLIKWAGPKGLMEKPDLKLATVYYDSFKVTDSNKVRMSACIILDEEVETEGEIGLTSMEGGKCIVARFEIGVFEFEKSWSSLFIWMNENGYRKADRHPFEIYHNNFNEHPEKKFIVDMCIPVE